MKSTLSKFLLISLLSSCVSTKIIPLQKDDSVAMSNKKITVVHNNKPNFSAMTYGNMMLSMFTGGIIGSIKMIRDGNKIINENSVADPAYAISSNLIEALKRDYRVTISDEQVAKDTDVSSSKISREYKNSSDYVLDVKTINWFFGYLPMRVSDYRVIYSSKLRVIDVSSERVIAEGFCAKIPDGKDQKEIYSYDALLADGAKNLKEELNKAASYCSSLFIEKVFNNAHQK